MECNMTIQNIITLIALIASLIFVIRAQIRMSIYEKFMELADELEVPPKALLEETLDKTKKK